MSSSSVDDQVVKSLRICRDAFPDLYFGMLCGRNQIALSVPQRPVRFIRLQSKGFSVLHLHHIEVIAIVDGAPKNIAPDAQVASSSCWPGSEYLLSRREFLNNHGHNFGFHTREETEPWLVVSLEQAMALERIVIHNRSDEYSSRAWLLSVDISDDGLTWSEIYSHPKREQQFSACLCLVAMNSTDTVLSSRQRCLVNDLLIHALRFEYVEGDRLLHTEDPEPSFKRQILAAINDHIVRARGLEWTNHGVKRTFRFWSEDEKVTYIRAADSVIRSMQSSGLGLDACFGYGAVLALLRDQNLMPHDDDLDIIVAAPRSRFASIAAFMEAVGAHLTRDGFHFSGDFASHRHVFRDGMEPVDIFFGFQEGEFVSWLPGPRKAILRNEVFPPRVEPLLGVDVSVPRSPVRYIAKIYGEQWAIPQPSWNHDWDKGSFSDWF